MATTKRSSVAESADHSNSARAQGRKSLTQEQQGSRGSAAGGADRPSRAELAALARIPKHLVARFKAIPSSDGGVHPACLSMTTTEQEFMGAKMGLQRQDWKRLVKSAVLALPQTTNCQYWMDWAIATRHLPEGSGCKMMNPSDALTQPESHGSASQDSHIAEHGYPMAVWRWIVSPDWEGDTLDSGFSLVQPDSDQNTPTAER